MERKSEKIQRCGSPGGFSFAETGCQKCRCKSLQSALNSEKYAIKVKAKQANNRLQKELKEKSEKIKRYAKENQKEIQRQNGKNTQK